jgi:hypothetical protein
VKSEENPGGPHDFDLDIVSDWVGNGCTKDQIEYTIIYYRSHIRASGISMIDGQK